MRSGFDCSRVRLLMRSGLDCRRGRCWIVKSNLNYRSSGGVRLPSCAALNKNGYKADLELHVVDLVRYFNSLSQNSRFLHTTFFSAFFSWYGNVNLSSKISQRIVLKSRIDNKIALDLTMASRWLGNKPFSKPIMAHWRIYVSLSLDELKPVRCT